MWQPSTSPWILWKRMHTVILTAAGNTAITNDAALALQGKAEPLPQPQPPADSDSSNLSATTMLP